MIQLGLPVALCTSTFSMLAANDSPCWLKRDLEGDDRHIAARPCRERAALMVGSPPARVKLACASRLFDPARGY